MAAVAQMDPWRLERLKRRLDALPHWLGESRRVSLAGLPPLEDMEGQFRLYGLRCLLLAQGARAGPAASSTTIWLGHGEPPARAPRLLLWPAPGQGEGHGEGEGDTPASPWGQVLPLPDPIHALWGLLAHHPPGNGLLRLPALPDWRPMLPLLRRLPPWLPLPGRLRQALLARALNLVRAHAVVAAPRPAGAILAAVLGRGFLGTPASDAYWGRW